MADVTKRRSSDEGLDDQAFIRACGPYRVLSHADGVLRVHPAWRGSVPKGCQAGPCAKCDCVHMGGVFTRMALANAISRVLNAKPARKKTR